MSGRDRLRYELRRAAYNGPLAGAARRLRAARERKQGADAGAWDADLAGGKAAYLADTLGVLTRARLAASLVAWTHAEARSMLDIGCGAGQLGEAARERGFDRFVGVDISRVAVEAAQERVRAHADRFPASSRFEVGSMGSWSAQEGERFDAIVFSEVLYYLPGPDDSVREMERCAAWLSPGGVLCVSMKDDGKSHAIIRAMGNRFAWERSMVFQEQEGRPRHRVRIDRQRPAYLIAAMKPRA
jgi:predicted TPR repeat methyltransferase